VLERKAQWPIEKLRGRRFDEWHGSVLDSFEIKASNASSDRLREYWRAFLSEFTAIVVIALIIGG
jgi:hypothetical protein